MSGQPVSSPADLLDPGIEPESPELQADSLPTELSGKPYQTEIQEAGLGVIRIEMVFKTMRLSHLEMNVVTKD